MRILVLGGAGMLGHKLCQVLSRDFETTTTVRSSRHGHSVPQYILGPAQVIDGVDACRIETVANAIQRAKPHAVINCIGIIKQIEAARDPVTSISINSLFPHKLHQLCAMHGARLIHMSTDCVFSGSTGLYTEDDNPDPTDLYGRSKLLGELQGDNCLTIRTSIIGRELDGAHGLVEWFLSQSGPTVPGFTNAIFSGLPTVVLANIIAHLIRDFPELHGLYHVSASPISKFDLLRLLAKAFDKDLTVEPFAGVRIDRSLNSDRFRKLTGYCPEPWPQLVAQVTGDPTPYGDWRPKHV